ncbi:MULTISPECIES: flagellar hook-associated protein 2 [unclassified Bacillus (in: firmicutes)]|uniref:flagellar hook-associated protein 2 n=1 Tax=unclassified Bacillus (in: firmicutes) TaxID=185979 RepID=UPI00232A99C3|nr:flagellar hook-associated protein 2 [Bacillus sp. BP-3]MDC2865749.1 flagellar hook-associated protein 2 [Bacillus sp. BP-3]
MAGTITGIGGGQQIWNLGDNLIDTSQLVQLELQTLEMRKTPYNNQKKPLADERDVYSSLKTQFKPFVQTFKDLAAFKGNQKNVNLSQDGYVSIQANESAITGTFNIEVKQLAERHQIASGTIADLNAKIGVDETIKINGKEMQLTVDMTYKDMINKINNGGYGVSAYTLGDKIFVSSTKEGTSGAITLEDGANNFLKNSGFLITKVDGTTAMNEINPAKNSIYTINGIEETSESNTVDKLPGVTIHLEKVTPLNQPIKFTVEDSNIKDSADIIKKMVSDYNKTVSTMDLYGGKGGSLQGQTIMQTIRQAMNDAVTFAKDGKYLFSFGIEMNKDGTMKVDETKLTQALKEDSEAAKQFFFGADGIGKQMEAKLDKIFGDQGIIGDHVKVLDEQITKLDRKIQDIDLQNKQKQESIVDKYSKLEQQLSMLNYQLKSIQAMTKQKNED